MSRNTAAEPDNRIPGLGSYNERVAARRKIAIAREILAHGPITGTRMLGITREIGLPASSPSYPNTLRQFGFLEQVPAKAPGQPVRWKVSAAGEAWVREQEVGV